MAMLGFRVRAVELMELLSFWRETYSRFHIRSQVRWRLTTHAELEKVGWAIHRIALTESQEMDAACIIRSEI